MAKGNREVVALICSRCKSQNYITTRNKINLEGKLTIKKFCQKCRAHTEHRETQKLK